jgi:type I restriction enzyme M protein
VTRKNAQSYLEDSHIAKIADAYTNYREVENFSKIVTVREISENDFSLSIPLYVKAKSGSEEEDTRTFESVYEDWDGTTRRAFRYYQQLNEMIRKRLKIRYLA